MIIIRCFNPTSGKYNEISERLSKNPLTYLGYTEYGSVIYHIEDSTVIANTSPYEDNNEFTPTVSITGREDAIERALSKLEQLTQLILQEIKSELEEARQK